MTLPSARFAWQVWRMQAIGGAARVLSRGRRGEWCDLLRGRASFCVAGARIRARQVKPLDFVALCEKIACVCVSG